MRFIPSAAVIVVFACYTASASPQQANAELSAVDCSTFERVATGYRVIKETPIVVSLPGQSYVITPRQGDIIEPDTVMIGAGAGRSLGLMIAGRCKS